jgi:secreted PhoX family phosphatase
MLQKALDVAMADEDVGTNLTNNPSLETLIEQRYSRRATLFGGLSATGAAVFGLSACDGDGGGDLVVPVATVVSAGAAATTTAGKMVRLAGSVTGPAAANTTFAQVSGPAATLMNANSAQASFIAPSVSAPTPLVFRLSATDPQGRAITSDTTVTVAPAKLDFAPVAKNLNDIVSVPAGYTVTVLYRLGDPLNASTPAYANNGADTNFAARAGDHHDALYFYGLAATGTARDDNNSARGLLLMNHENITQAFLHPAGPTGTGPGQSRPEAEVIKEMEAHGVSAVEVTRGAQGGWSYVQNSPFNRRITPLTEVAINGPARGDAQMRTQFSPDGTRGRGTVNNCANGYTPWGTVPDVRGELGLLLPRDRGDDANRPAKQVTSLNRNGIREGATGNYGWTTVNPRTRPARPTASGTRR